MAHLPVRPFFLEDFRASLRHHAIPRTFLSIGTHYKKFSRDGARRPPESWSPAGLSQSPAKGHTEHWLTCFCTLGKLSPCPRYLLEPESWPTGFTSLLPAYLPEAVGKPALWFLLKALWAA